MARHLHIALMMGVLAATGWEVHGQKGKLIDVNFDEANLEEIIAFFRDRGAGQKKRNVLVDPRIDKDVEVTLRLRGVTKGVAFAYVAELAGFDYREEQHALRIVPAKPGSKGVKGFIRNGGAATWQHAKGIALPKVAFEDAELKQVVRDIADACRQLDPKKKGINIVLGRGVDPTTPITLQLQDVPASAAIRYVAEMAQLKIRTDGPALVLVAPPKPAKKSP